MMKKGIIITIIAYFSIISCQKFTPPQENPEQKIKSLLFSQERFAEALAEAEKSLQNNINDASLLYLRGMAHVALKNYDSALNDFVAAMKSDSANPLPYNGIGNVFYLKYEDLLAEKFWNRGLSLAKTPSTRALFLGNLSLLAMNAKKYGDAIKLIEEANSISRDGRFYNLLGRVYDLMNKTDKAKETWLAALHDQTLPWAQHNFKHNTCYRLAALYASKKDHHEALKYAGLALELSPTTIEYQKTYVKLKELIK
jgi:tetratricopeptide (TPR) repeat protein